jgi:LmbE family N-acetylglucosaminyl deacetylase
MTTVLPLPPGPIAAVVAHPDDESFGLGGLLAALAAEGRPVHVLCLTHGEASTLGLGEALAEVRRGELTAAAVQLGVATVRLLDLPDGHLEACPAEELDGPIADWLSPDIVAVVAFEPNGVTGHGDHRAATAAAERIADRVGVPVVEWGVDPATARYLGERYATSFAAIPDGPDVLDLVLDRDAQHAAVQCHRSQLDDDALVLGRLAFQGDHERVRVRNPRLPVARS